jgi:hypothetical protein
MASGRGAGPQAQGSDMTGRGGRGARERTTAGGRGREPRVCAGCGRSFAWRAALADDWEHVRWCSDACRRRGVREVDLRLEQAITDLLAARAHDASICPSEAARRVDPDGWEALMEPARRAARRLVAAGEVDIVQGGRVVDPSTARGPIRVRRARARGTGSAPL